MFTSEELAKVYRRLGEKEKKVILALLIFCFVIGLIIPAIFSKNTAVQKLPAVPTPTTRQLMYADLVFDKLTKPVVSQKEFSVDVVVSSPDYPIEAADIYVNFDPAYLTPVEISEGEYFHNYPLKKIGKDFIKISALANFDGTTITVPKGQGTIATIKFKALKTTTSTVLTFDHMKTIMANDGKNITGILNSLSIQID